MKIFIYIFVFIIAGNLHAQERTLGLFFNEPEAVNGYTLFTPNNVSYLIDNCGYLVKTWESEYRQGLSAYLDKNGNLVRTGFLASHIDGAGAGGIIEIFNWDGEIIWSHVVSDLFKRQHHDIEVLPNGNILVLAWEVKSSSELIEVGYNNTETQLSTLYGEAIYEYKPIGVDQAELVWEWHAFDHLVQNYDPTRPNYGVVADHPELLDINKNTEAGLFGSGPDWMHANSVNYNPERDEILISSRNLNEFYIIDHSTSSEEAASHTGGDRGKGGDILFRWGNPFMYDQGSSQDQKLFGQHDAKWIPKGYHNEGKIMVFNNGILRPGGDYSSIEIINPKLDNEGNYTLEENGIFGPEESDWSFCFEEKREFISTNMGGAQPMKNGNVLICSSNQNLIFETDKDKNLVWYYVNPVGPLRISKQGNPVPTSSTFRATKYLTDYEGFIGRELNTFGPIELDPLPYECNIYTAPSGDQDYKKLEAVTLLTNPILDNATILNKDDKKLIFQLFDTKGILLSSGTLNDSRESISMTAYPSAAYILQLIDEESQAAIAFKIIKL